MRAIALTKPDVEIIIDALQEKAHQIAREAIKEEDRSIRRTKQQMVSDILSLMYRMGHPND